MPLKTNNVLNSKFLLGHFLFIFLLSLILTTALYLFIIPITYWAWLGEGEIASQIESKPIHRFLEQWLALIIILSLLIGLLIYNKNTSKAKSFLYTIIAIVLLYLFRIPIIDLIISV